MLARKKNIYNNCLKVELTIHYTYQIFFFFLGGGGVGSLVFYCCFPSGDRMLLYTMRYSIQYWMELQIIPFVYLYFLVLEYSKLKV